MNIGKSISAKSTISAVCPLSRATAANLSANSRLVPEVAVIIRKFAMMARGAIRTSTDKYHSTSIIDVEMPFSLAKSITILVHLLVGEGIARI